jgi:ketosteroid isomerase-like protein
MSSPLPPRLMRLLPLALLALSAAAARGSAQQPTAPRTAADIATIKRAGAEFSQKYMRGDNQGMADLYTEDGMILPPGRPIIKGRPAIAEYWKLQPGAAVVDHKTTADSIIVRGDIAYDYGTFRAQNSRDGQVGNPGFGKYVIVWRRQTDGRWLMHLDIWNSSPAATP